MKEKRRYTSARERAEKQKTGFQSTAFTIPDGVQLFAPKAGRYLLDIIPFVAGAGNPWAEEGCIHWERTYYTHRSIGANGDTYACPRMTAKQRCPICEHRLRLMKEGDQDNENLISDLSPKQRQLFQVIDLKEPGKGIQLWDMSYHLFGKMLDARLRNSEEDDSWDNFFHLEDGLTLKVAFIEKTFGGFSYVETESIDFRSRKEQYEEEWLEKGHCLDELVLVTEYDELKKIFLEAKEPNGKKKDDEDDDTGDEDDAPPPKKKKVVDEDEDDAPPPPKKKPVEEEDDEDDAPFKKKKPVEEDEEDEKPAPKKKKAPKDEDEDWNDFDKDDDDEDEPPPKKKKVVDEDEDDEDEKPRIRAGAPKDEDEEPPKKKKRPVEDED